MVNKILIRAVLTLIVVVMCNLVYGQSIYNSFGLGVSYGTGSLKEKNKQSRSNLNGYGFAAYFEHYRWNKSLTNAFGYKLGASLLNINNGTQTDSSYISLVKTVYSGMIFWRRAHFGLGITGESYGMSYARGFGSTWPSFNNQFIYAGATVFVPFGGDLPGQFEVFYKKSNSFGGTIIGGGIDFKRVFSKYIEVSGKVESFNFPQGDQSNPVISSQLVTEIVLAFTINGTKTK